MSNLIQFGHDKMTLVLPEALKGPLFQQDWQELDKRLAELVTKDGIIFKALTPYTKFSQIEYITSIRDAKNEWEEDGIWHDDGSRVLAFSLSLNVAPEKIGGGIVQFRKKGQAEILEIPIQKYGVLVVFATGVWGWEHKVLQVTHGQRVVMAGWCS
ncbi:MAG: 2OG-Fe(II) oxygenase [Bacteriovoracaceae bacterium]|nr:2OG-Fe(II) oxygenase [Bacteriovoracaceae bacterium]